MADCCAATYAGYKVERTPRIRKRKITLRIILGWSTIVKEKYLSPTMTAAAVDSNPMRIPKKIIRMLSWRNMKKILKFPIPNDFKIPISGFLLTAEIVIVFKIPSPATSKMR